jgi:hypothetical protein
MNLLAFIILLLLKVPILCHCGLVDIWRCCQSEHGFFYSTRAGHLVEIWATLFCH